MDCIIPEIWKYVGKVGQWREDLSKETLAKIENEFSKEMREIGYIN